MTWTDNAYNIQDKKVAKDLFKKGRVPKNTGREMRPETAAEVMELKAASTLADISRLPPARCHELSGNRNEQLSVDLEHPYRLLFIVADNPYPERECGGLEWEGVTEIEIIEIVDTHE